MGKDPDRGELGSSGFPVGFDTVIWIEKHKKNDETGVQTIQFLVRKQKDAEDRQRYWMQSNAVMRVARLLGVAPVKYHAAPLRPTGRVPGQHYTALVP
jgi:hypothetical protein